MFGVVISPVNFGQDLFCYSSFKFFNIEDKDETNLITKSTRTFNYS